MAHWSDSRVHISFLRLLPILAIVALPLLCIDCHGSPTSLTLPVVHPAAIARSTRCPLPCSTISSLTLFHLALPSLRRPPCWHCFAPHRSREGGKRKGGKRRFRGHNIPYTLGLQGMTLLPFLIQTPCNLGPFRSVLVRTCMLAIIASLVKSYLVGFSLVAEC